MKNIGLETTTNNGDEVLDGGDYYMLAAGDSVQIKAAHTDTGTINLVTVSTAVSLVRVGD